MVDISKIEIKNNGYITCYASRYSILSVLNDEQYIFTKGINILDCEIDSPEVAISYLMSMYNQVNDKLLFGKHIVNVNGQPMTLKKFSSYVCYLDEAYPLFCKKNRVKKLIKKGLSKSKINYTLEQIIEIFGLSDRMDKPLKANGNEKFRAMAAIGFAYGKQVFCFPWFSKKLSKYYKHTMIPLLNILKKEKKIAIVPVSEAVNIEKIWDGVVP